MTNKRIALALFLLFASGSLLLATTIFNSGVSVTRLSDGKTVAFADMIEELQGAQVVFVGELHDNMEHHDLQLRIIKELKKKKEDVAVALEMFTADSQPRLDDWVEGNMDQLEFIRLYYRNWQMPWPLYRDILLYSRREKLPLVGLNIDPELTSQVAKHGFASLSQELKDRVPRGVTCDVDPVYMQFIQEAHSFHGTEDRTFRHFCEAQILWDKSMALHLADFITQNPEKTVVVLAGGGHAMKRGIPRRLAETKPVTTKVVLPLIPGHGGISSTDADYVVVP